MEEIIKEFEKLGYTHKESEEFTELSQLECPVQEAITDIELAEMFGLSLDQFKQEVKDGTIICAAEEDKIFIIPSSADKPLKVVYEGDITVKDNADGVLEIYKIIDNVRATNLFNDIFGTTDVGIFDCNDMTEEEFCDFIDKFNSIPCISF